MTLIRYLGFVLCACLTGLCGLAQTSSDVTVSFKVEGRPFSVAKNAALAAAPNLGVSSQVFVDGVSQGPIPDSGILELTLAAGDHSVSGVYDGIMGGSSDFTVESGTPMSVTVVMTGEGILFVLPAEGRLNGLEAPILSSSVNRLEFTLSNEAGQPYALAGDQYHVDVFRARISTNGHPKRIGSGFELSSEFSVVQGGKLAATSPASVMALLLSGGPGPFVFDVVATDQATGLPIFASIHVTSEASRRD